MIAKYVTVTFFDAYIFSLFFSEQLKTTYYVKRTYNFVCIYLMEFPMKPARRKGGARKNPLDTNYS